MSFSPLDPGLTPSVLIWDFAGYFFFFTITLVSSPTVILCYLISVKRETHNNRILLLTVFWLIHPQTNGIDWNFWNPVWPLRDLMGIGFLLVQVGRVTLLIWRVVGLFLSFQD